MNKSNTKQIFFGLGILAILISIAIAPNQTNAYGYYGGTDFDNTYQTPIYNSAPTSNPSPVINSIDPSSSNVGVGTKTITIIGEGFIPGSIVKINGANRPTTFIDGSHLLIQVTGNDMLTYQSNGGFFITVFNGAPGGGYSNAVLFAIGEEITNTTNDTATNFTDIEGNGIEQDSNNLAANAIFGANGIFPSGLIQWVIFAILILVIVILVRRVYGADQRYHDKPMKHE